MDKQQLLELVKPHLLNLMNIINNINVPMEGSLFFEDQAHGLTLDCINDRAIEKAISLFEFASNKNELLEIGFNSGLSALVFLLANENIKVTSVDTSDYLYIIPCYKYMKEVFKDRIDLIKGNSLEILPVLLQEKSNFDGYFVDGCHLEEIVRSDFGNIIKYANSGVEICADDYYAPDIKKVVHEFIDAGNLQLLNSDDWLVFVKLIK